MNSAKLTSNKRRQWLTAGIALVVLIFAVLFLFEPQQSAVAKDSTALKPPLVSTIHVSPQPYQATITALGEVRARWQSQLRSFVRGEVIELSPEFLAGNRVKKGQLLLSIENSSYRVQLAEAKSRLSNARVNLLEAQRQMKQAKSDWKLSGVKTKPDSELILHRPQLKVAQDEWQAAQVAVAAAEKQFSYTRVVAPFDATIISRSVNPNETLEVGQTLAELIRSDILDIPVPLTQQQWQLLPENWQGLGASLNSLASDLSWQAILSRSTGVIDPQNRQRTIILTASADHELVSGRMVEAQLPGKTFEQLLKVPQSAITRDGYLYLVDKSNRLQRIRANQVFTKDGFNFIHKPDSRFAAKELKGQALYQVAVMPLLSFLPGTHINPVLQKDHALTAKR
ncbi:efflux RND transporter periplasmic adaptor subunit [Thalassomonas actiniarum]|uniref:Efflux RND transporter periplasmic adaptor subunit n=1 Tax=Thalassomonas actiniarum TaxID=485447 RepID=A0AAE9YVJ0_9GAMM|nr:efflux RND transporter periplasmic adaptor subunit [Thalassomonas actiniarum]WDE00308.1 efflux RND transporter periplasmic adaptor subunit [Thalassomonas actiniarum]